MLQGTVLSMGKQLKNHRKTISRIIGMLGKKSLARNYLNKCLYSVATGSNDYINNYFLPQYYNTSQEYTLEEYAVVLVEQYSRQILVTYIYLVDVLNSNIYIDYRFGSYCHSFFRDCMSMEQRRLFWVDWD